MDLNNKIIVFFDGNCNLCNFWVKKVLIHNQKENIYFTKLNSAFSKKQSIKLCLDISKHNSVVVLKENKIYTKSDAILIVLKNLAFPFSAISTLLSLVPNIITNFIYELIAKNRIKIFGSSNNCDYKLFYKKNRMLK